MATFGEGILEWAGQTPRKAWIPFFIRVYHKTQTDHMTLIIWLVAIKTTIKMGTYQTQSGKIVSWIA